MDKFKNTLLYAAVLATVGIQPSMADDSTGDMFERKVFLEEFTTENCNNCPAASVKLHNILELPEYENRLIAVCHHVGFETDWLTLPEEKDYLWLYNSDEKYAPGLMIDRMPTFTETSPVFGMTLLSEEQISEEIDKRLTVLSPVSVKVSAEVSDDGEVSVTVEGEKTAAEPQKDAKVTLYLVENDVPAHRQSGALDGFIHQHVTRAMNSTWGESISWKENKFNYRYTFRLEDTWNHSNMEVVAIVNRDVPSNVLKCEVLNADSYPLEQKPSGISGTAAEAVTPTAFYDLTGRRLNACPESGLYIAVYSDGSARKLYR
jgi:hypothetical protein